MYSVVLMLAMSSPEAAQTPQIVVQAGCQGATQEMAAFTSGPGPRFPILANRRRLFGNRIGAGGCAGCAGVGVSGLPAGYSWMPVANGPTSVGVSACPCACGCADGQPCTCGKGVGDVGGIVSRLAVKREIRGALARLGTPAAGRIAMDDDASDALASAVHKRLVSGAGGPSGNLLAQILAFLSSPVGQALIQQILSLFGL